MADLTGETDRGALRLDFDRRLILQFRGSAIISDGGLLAYRELDDALSLTDTGADALADAPTGRNGRHLLVGLLRQSVFGRLAGYEDVNDADRLCRDPAMRWVVGHRAITECAASASQMGRFETKWLSRRYRGIVKRLYFRGDAAFANPEMYEFLEAVGYTIRLPANSVLQRRIGYLLKRPVGRPSHEVRRYYASFSYQARSWGKPRRVVAKVEWHPGELYPRVGFIVTNLPRPAERVVAFYNQRGAAEQYIKEGKGAIKWTRLSCRTFAANAVRLQLHALAYNLGNFMGTLALTKTAEPWSLTSLREKLIKIGAKGLQPRPLHHLPNGRGCGVAADVR
jgi:DDE family transposase